MNLSTMRGLDIDYAAGGDIIKLSAKEAWITIEDYVQYDKEMENLINVISDQSIANLKAQVKKLVGNEMVRVEIPRYISWLGSTHSYDEHIGSLGMMDNQVGNTSPQSTPQILPSFKEYTSPVTYLKEVEETLGTPMEVEPLDQTKLKDVGLTNHNISLSFMEVPSFDEPEPQPNPYPVILDKKSLGALRISTWTILGLGFGADNVVNSSGWRIGSTEWVA
ncbi:hypothetical protein Tco_0930006 [Tanacetum coccineum]